MTSSARPAVKTFQLLLGAHRRRLSSARCFALELAGLSEGEARKRPRGIEDQLGAACPKPCKSRTMYRWFQDGSNIPKPRMQRKLLSKVSLGSLHGIPLLIVLIFHFLKCRKSMLVDEVHDCRIHRLAITELKDTAAHRVQSFIFCLHRSIQSRLNRIPIPLPRTATLFDMPVSVQDLEAVFDGLVGDILGHFKQYNIPDSVCKQLKKASPPSRGDHDHEC